ncbi:protein rep, partial [Streptococcus caprae]
MVTSQEQRNKYIAQTNEEFEILHDVTKTGKDRKWKERKQANLRHAKRMEKLGYDAKKVERVETCADVLKFVQDPIKGMKLYQAYFCGNKLCPMCNWRRSMKYSWQAKTILEEALKRRPKARFLFLTLTIKNVPAKALSEAIKELNKSFDRLFRRKTVKKNMIGFIRAMEVTYNDETGLYHPHIHVLLMVTPTYFARDNYLSQSDWTEMWEQSAKLNYTPIVHIKAVKEK